MADIARQFRIMKVAKNPHYVFCMRNSAVALHHQLAAALISRHCEMVNLNNTYRQASSCALWAWQTIGRSRRVHLRHKENNANLEYRFI